MGDSKKNRAITMTDGGAPSSLRDNRPPVVLLSRRGCRSLGKVAVLLVCVIVVSRSVGFMRVFNEGPLSSESRRLSSAETGLTNATVMEPPVPPNTDKDTAAESSSMITNVQSSLSALGTAMSSEMQQQKQPSSSQASSSMKILYIMTTLAEYNTGSRNTVKGSDRLQETLIPVLVEGVESMQSFGYQVDVYLICHFTMRPERLKLIRDRLPPSVGLDFWDDATPLGYKLEQKEKAKKMDYVTRALARQHRYVIKDRFLDYDFFVNFEDDMLVKGDHVENFMEMSYELLRLREQAPDDIPEEYRTMAKFKYEKVFHGPLTKTQLSRILPGFMRVEVLLDEENYGSQPKLDPVPVDSENGTLVVNPQPCCHVTNKTSSDHIPMAPSSDKLVLWETAIEALGVRQMPTNSTMDWVMLQRGPNYAKSEKVEIVGDYWSRRMLPDNKVHRPTPNTGAYVNNQGGWMATRQQIWEWHTEICPGGFLPPYGEPHYNFDGMDLRNVEYWSGGLHLFTRLNACNLQRIVSLDPARFSRQLLYHTANNKQRQLHGKVARFVKVNNLLGQLNAVRKQAQEELSPGR